MVDTKQKLLGLLGLANRAGKLALGASAIEGMVRRGRRPLVVIASDIGPAQRRKLKNLAPVRAFAEDLLDRHDLARACGRRELAAVAVSDMGFVKGLLPLLGTKDDIAAAAKRHDDDDTSAGGRDDR